jgi:hypothetical protein
VALLRAAGAARHRNRVPVARQGGQDPRHDQWHLRVAAEERIRRRCEVPVQFPQRDMTISPEAGQEIPRGLIGQAGQILDHPGDDRASTMLACSRTRPAAGETTS